MLTRGGYAHDDLFAAVSLARQVGRNGLAVQGNRTNLRPARGGAPDGQVYLKSCRKLCCISLAVMVRRDIHVTIAQPGVPAREDWRARGNLRNDRQLAASHVGTPSCWWTTDQIVP